MKSGEEIKVILADDHQLVRDGLRELLKQADQITVIGEAVNGKDLLGHFALADADVVLVDVDMPEMNGIEAARMISRNYPEKGIIALTMHDEAGVIRQMKDAGASGYLLKNTTMEEVSVAIRKVAGGGKYFSAEVTESLLTGSENPDAPNIASLTDRELEVLKLIAEGFSNTEIGEKLFISHRTVDTHRTNLMKKLNAKNIAGLIRIAFQHKLIQ